MTKSIKITVIIIGLLSIGAGAYSFIKGSQDQIGTAFFTKTAKDQK